MKGAGQAPKARLIPLKSEQRSSVSPTPGLSVRWTRRLSTYSVEDEIQQRYKQTGSSTLSSWFIDLV